MRYLKNKLMFVIFCFVLFFGISLAINIDVDAYSQGVNIANDEVYFITEGEEISANDIANELYYNGIRIYPDIKAFNIKVNGTSIGNKKTNTAILNTTSLGLSDSKKYVVGTIELTYINPSTTEQENKYIDLYILRNYAPNISIPQIYVSSSQLDTYKTIPDNEDVRSLYQDILSQLVISDVDGTLTTSNYKDNTEIFDSAGDFDINTYQKGTTELMTITVTDYNKSKSIPLYITFLKDNDDTNELDKRYVKVVDKTYFPYHLADIKRDVNGNYYARKQDGIFYYLDKDNDFLLNEKGDKFPVDAGLSVLIQPTSNPILYKIVPLSKWIKNGGCFSLLTSCIENSGDDKTFISSWTFSANDAKKIKETLTTNNTSLDKSFYHNYFINGYCELGTKEPNEIERNTSFVSFSEIGFGNTGLRWGVIGDTLFIKAEEIASSTYTYKMPDFTLIDNISTAPWTNQTFSKIDIDNKVRHIGNYAFYGCTNITGSIELPEECVTIGKYAFANCVNITGDLKTKYIHEIGDYAFYNCYGLKGKLHLGQNSLNKIGNSAFESCGFTNSLLIPSSVTNIGSSAFKNCLNFTGSLTIGNNVRTIGASAFEGCTGFDGDLKIPTELTAIEPLTFANCTGLNGKLMLNDKATKIDDYAFYNCYNLTGDVELPEECLKVGIAAFKGCKSLKTTLIINKKLVSIGIQAFYGCQNITTVNNDNESTSLEIQDGAFFTKADVATKITSPQHNVGGNPVDSIFALYTFKKDRRTVTEY